MTAPLKENQQQPQAPLATGEVKAPINNLPPVQGKKRSHLLMIVTLVLALIGLGWFLLWFLYLQFYASTDDAYSNGSIVNINSPITGSVIAFYADDTDLVIEGQLLAELDPTYYQVAYDKALAELAAEAIQVKQLSDNVLVNQADVAIKNVAFSKARYDYENRSQLIGSKAISNEDFTHARDDLTTAEADLKKSQYQLQASLDVLGTGPLEKHPRIEEMKATVREAYCNLKHCKIYAPTTGYVAMRSVNVGQSVVRTTNLMAVIPVDYVWVDANFKETQLTDMRVGQPATVWFDLYGSHVKYQGKVLGIASGSGSVFSLIPPQNATGNWIKIVQRLPVRISLDPEIMKDYPVRLGISAEVEVDIRDQDLPKLTQIISKKPVTTTDVFEIDLQEINLIIDRIVLMNLRE